MSGTERNDPAADCDQQIVNVSQTILIGMARPMPSASWAFAVATPTTCFCALTTGPPELPGLIGASNCSRSPSARRSDWRTA